MHRRKLLLAGSSATVIALAGCLDVVSGDDGDENTTQTTATITGEGRIEAEPDLARFEATVTETGDSMTLVRDRLAQRAESLRETLLDAGIPEDRMTTGTFQIRERVERDHPEQDEDQQRYFEGEHSISVEVLDLDRVGELVDTAIDGGADEIDRIQFGLTEDTREALREEALGAAIKDAAAEAEAIANELDATVIDERTIDASTGSVSPIPLPRETLEGDGNTEVYPDEITVPATVEITYVLE